MINIANSRSKIKRIVLFHLHFRADAGASPVGSASCQTLNMTEAHRIMMSADSNLELIKLDHSQVRSVTLVGRSRSSPVQRPE